MVARARAITIHARQQDFASAQLFDFPRPFDGIQPGWDAPAVDVDFPMAVNPLRIDGDDDTLTAELLRTQSDKFRIAHGPAVERDFIRARQQRRANILN